MPSPLDLSSHSLAGLVELYGRRRIPLHGGPKEPAPDKGKQGGACNRSACQAPNSATWWNCGTDAWYCPSCARAINDANLAHGQICFPQKIDRERAIDALEFASSPARRPLSADRDEAPAGAADPAPASGDDR